MVFFCKDFCVFKENLVFSFSDMFHKGLGVGTFISNVGSMFFQLCVKRASHLTYVANLARTRNQINTPKLSMINRIFDGSYLLFNVFRGFERGCNVILTSSTKTYHHRDLETKIYTHFRGIY